MTALMGGARIVSQASDELAKSLAEAVRAVIRELDQSAPIREPPEPSVAAPKWLDEVPDVLTVEDAAEVLRIGRNAAYELVRTGDLFAVRTGGRSLRVPKAALVAYLGGVDWQEAVRRHVDQMLADSG